MRRPRSRRELLRGLLVDLLAAALIGGVSLILLTIMRYR